MQDNLWATDQTFGQMIHVGEIQVCCKEFPKAVFTNFNGILGFYKK
jgi:hypothetical protein